MRSLKAAESMTPDTNILEVEISLPDASLVTCQKTFFWILHDEEGLTIMNISWTKINANNATSFMIKLMRVYWFIS